MLYFSIDSQQRQQVLDPSQSFIVQAPAGSGKTELLIQRFLALLATVTEPEDILAITFTKKAANEMKDRVLKALKQASGAEIPSAAYQQQTFALATAVLARDQQYCWHLLLSTHRLRIQTIDAFCAGVVQSLPVTAVSAAQFVLTDQAVVLYQRAVNKLFYQYEQLHCTEAWSYLLLDLHNDTVKLQAWLVDLLAKRDQWQIYLEQAKCLTKEGLEQQAIGVIITMLTQLTTLFPAHLLQELLAIGRFAARQLIAAGSHAPLTTCETCYALVDLEALWTIITAHIDNITYPDDVTRQCVAAQTMWQGLATLLLTKTGQWRRVANRTIGLPAATEKGLTAEEKQQRKVYKQRFLALIDILQSSQPLKQALYHVMHLPHPQYTETAWQTLVHLLTVLRASVICLEQVCHEEGRTDYIGNMQAAQRLLHASSTSTVATWPGIKHILFDEFQDTSLAQYRLLQTLTKHWPADGTRTLFIVGDPLQSIIVFAQLK